MPKTQQKINRQIVKQQNYKIEKIQNSKIIKLKNCKKEKLLLKDFKIAKT